MCVQQQSVYMNGRMGLCVAATVCVSLLSLHFLLPFFAFFPHSQFIHMSFEASFISIALIAHTHSLTFYTFVHEHSLRQCLRFHRHKHKNVSSCFRFFVFVSHRFIAYFVVASVCMCLSLCKLCLCYNLTQTNGTKRNGILCCCQSIPSFQLFHRTTL